MKHILKIITIIFFWMLCFGFHVHAQDSTFFKLVKAEIDIYYKFSDLYTFQNDAQRDSMNDQILSKLGQILEYQMSFNYPFDSLLFIGKKYSPDLKFRIYTWNIPAMNGTHTYYGFIQFPGKKNQPCIVIRLYDRSPEIVTPETRILSDKNWWGALYYEIIMNKYKGRRMYTLIGFDLHDRYSNKKVIDVLTFDDNNAPVFGHPALQMDGKIKNRMIFEYAEDVVMTIRYSANNKMIVFDHLSPIEPAFKNNPRYWAPDSSYDGFRFNKGIWEYMPDIDVRNP